MTAKVKVVYIGGYSRSGSTLLLRCLGQRDDFVAVGEVWDIWRRSFSDDQLCGCGEPFHQCLFWEAVVQEAFGGFAQVDAAAMHALRRSVQGNHYLPLLAWPALRPKGYRARLAAYAQVLGRLYQAIHRVAGGRIIIDSSKVAPYAFLLQHVPGIELHVVHLVRDSRATAYSWQRRKVRPEIHWTTAYMEQYSPFRSALEWNIMNALLGALRHSAASFVRLRYEDLVQAPGQAVARIVAAVGQARPGPEDAARGDVLEFGVDHTVSGNPNRFERGAVPIRPDVEWQTKMPATHKGIVTALTWPLLAAYGYLGRRAAHPPRLTAPPKASGAQAPLRVLMVTARYLPHIGGTELHTFEVARRLAAAGNEVTVLTARPGAAATAVEQGGGLRVIRVPAWPRRSDYYFAPAVARVIREGPWDLVHCQGYHTLMAPLAMLAAWRAGIPYVVSFHSGGHSSWLRNAFRPLQRALLRPLLARAAALVGVSQWEADFFRTRLGLPAERFSVIPNGSYLPRVSRRAPAHPADMLIVSIGRLERYKGHHRVIAALPAVRKQYPRARLRIVGAGPYEAALQQLAHELRVSEHVEIKAVSGNDRDGMAALLSGAALVILLSDYESQSMSVMEALALGRPVLVADATALSELAASGLARATPLGSTPDEVAQAILDQLQRPLFPAQTNLPTWEACAEAIHNLYRHALNGGAACAS